jgi:hypothetical protein
LPLVISTTFLVILRLPVTGCCTVFCLIELAFYG